MHTLRRLLYTSALMAMLLAAWFYLHVHSSITLSTIPYEFSVRAGSNLKQIAQQLEDDRVILNKWTFILLARYLNQESAIKAGDYLLKENITQLELLSYLTSGDAKRNAVRFIEGWTFVQLRQTLNDHPLIKKLTTDSSEHEILRLIGASETAAEGIFFPDTYYFLKDTSDIEILQRAYRTMHKHLQSEWASRAESLPLTTPYEALILASIVEKETGMESDRAEIAGVFINRLRQGMRLQTDPTVIYGLGEKFDGNLRKKDLLTDQTYNTYTRHGLPPTPIAMPGLASIRAALNPAETDSLYFVAKGNGASHFSTNLADHNKAVNKYQKQQKQNDANNP